MRPLVLVTILMFVLSAGDRPCVGAGAAADSARGDASGVRLIIPVRRSKPGSVRIRSVHDNRRILIISAPAAGRPALGADSWSTSGLATSAQLAEMEIRLMAYLDGKTRPPEIEPAGASVVPPAPSAASGQSVSRTTKRAVVPVPVPIPLAAEAVRETTYVQSPTAVAAAAPDTSDTARVASPSAPDTSGFAATVVEVERAILDAELFRTAQVLFETNSANLMPASSRVLDAVGVVLDRHPEIRLEVRGHTDNRGEEDYNLALSEARAEAVRRYLTDEFGLDEGRVVSTGVGEEMPIADNESATGRALNRRVEFLVLK